MKKITVDYVSDQLKYINGREVFPPEAVPQVSRAMLFDTQKTANHNQTAHNHQDSLKGIRGKERFIARQRLTKNLGKKIRINRLRLNRRRF
jgi:hypothetical protein